MNAIWDPGSLIYKRENLLSSSKPKIHIHFYIWTELIFSWYWLSCNKIIVCRFYLKKKKKTTHSLRNQNVQHSSWKLQRIPLSKRLVVRQDSFTLNSEPDSSVKNNCLKLSFQASATKGYTDYYVINSETQKL